MASPNTISFGPGQAQNADLQAQQMQLQRQQKLADLLRQQSLTQAPTQIVSGIAVKNSPLLGAAQLAKAFLANKMDEDSDKQQEQIGTAAAQRSAAALRAMAPAGVFDDAPAAGAQAAPTAPPQAPTAPASAPTPQLTDTPQMSTPGQVAPAPVDTPAPAPAPAPAATIDPETRARWVRAIATYQQNPEVGGKLIEELNKSAEFSTTPQYDQAGNAFVLDKSGNAKYLKGVKSRDKLENINGVWVNPYAQQDGATGPQDFNQPFITGPDGKIMANPAYQKYQMDKAKAGATNVSTKTEVKMAESLAGQVGPIMEKSMVAAQGAQGQIDAAQRITKALDSGKVYTGPFASRRLQMAQLGQSLGIGGKDDDERIANTRQAIRGLAEMTLQGRKQMSGQGAITDRESALAEKATSGDIDNLTPAELRIIVGASQRASQHTIDNHNRLIARTRADKNTAGLADYYDLTPMQGQSSVDDLLKKYGGK